MKDKNLKKPVSIGSLMDGCEFRIQSDGVGTVYSLQRKKGKKAIYTSSASGRTYQTALSTKVYPVPSVSGARESIYPEVGRKRYMMGDNF